MQLKYHMVTIEDLVPEDHFLRKLEKWLNNVIKLRFSCAQKSAHHLLKM